jgi:hypothetical protein
VIPEIFVGLNRHFDKCSRARGAPVDHWINRSQPDFDFGKNHKGAGDPHAHDWTNGVRGPGRPIGPNE